MEQSSEAAAGLRRYPSCCTYFAGLDIAGGAVPHSIRRCFVGAGIHAPEHLVLGGLFLTFIPSHPLKLGCGVRSSFMAGLLFMAMLLVPNGKSRVLREQRTTARLEGASYYSHTSLVRCALPFQIHAELGVARGYIMLGEKQARDVVIAVFFSIMGGIFLLC